MSNSSIDDFVIIEYNGDIGGRAYHTEFGKQPDGSPYTVELGANWVCRMQRVSSSFHAGHSPRCMDFDEDVLGGTSNNTDSRLI